MRGLRKYLTPFAPDQSGAVSVLYELGGIIVICDAGGCTGNVCGFDEPRWFQNKSAVFSAGLRDMDAILGRDDRLVAKLADAFGMDVIAYSRTPGKVAGVRYVSLEELLAQADVVSLHVPLTDETRGMIGAEELALMKETAVLVNTARGPVVDTKALADALNSGRIAGAAIDVFDKEPPLDADEPLINAKNTVVTPHVAFATDESMIKRAEIEFRNIAEFIKDKC